MICVLDIFNVNNFTCVNSNTTFIYCVTQVLFPIEKTYLSINLQFIILQLHYHICTKHCSISMLHLRADNAHANKDSRLQSLILAQLVELATELAWLALASGLGQVLAQVVRHGADTNLDHTILEEK